LEGYALGLKAWRQPTTILKGVRECETRRLIKQIGIRGEMVKKDAFI
jgi:hypothetical protein